MNQQAVKERLKAAPNPIIDNYRKIVDTKGHQVVDQNNVGWHVLEMTVFAHRRQFFDAQGHWKSWKDQSLRDAARNAAETAVSIGVTLTQYWQGRSLNLMQDAMIKPYLKIDKKRFFN